ncbi:hypothetical protein KKD03_04705, partial [Patescibacteria group bacterium]|nr:hypothetical protein [Patescibacteria group bacterium]
MQITNTLRAKIFESLTDLGLSDLSEVSGKNILLEHPADKSHGDYSTNIAMILFGEKKFSFNSPRDLAQAISDDLQNKLDVGRSNDQASNRHGNQPNDQ